MFTRLVKLLYCTNRVNYERWYYRSRFSLSTQVDAYLAKEVSAGHPGAISFVIDLLDHFVLPCPSGTAVGAAAAAAAAAAANYVRSVPPAMVNGPQAANTSTGPTSSNTTAPGSITAANQSSKREFTVLNEYDLWSTLEAMRNRVSALNAVMSTNSSSGSRFNTLSLTDPLALRLRLACARVRGLLDLGLLEQSPLFVIPPGCTQPPIGALYAGCSQAREFDDPPTLQVFLLLFLSFYLISVHRSFIYFSRYDVNKCRNTAHERCFLFFLEMLFHLDLEHTFGLL